MKGFFSKKETESESRVDGKILSCVSCGGYKKCKTPKMKPVGNFKKKILIIGSAPERSDDRQGKPFQSANAMFLMEVLANLGVNMFDDCLLYYAHHCYNPDAECDPSNYEIECCRKSTIQVVKENKPKLIILLGDAAVFSLIGHRWKKDMNDIDKWRGWTIPDQDFKAWLCPTYETYQVKDKPEALTIWKQDLERALECLDREFPVYVEPEIITLQNDLSVLSTIQNDFAFDFETTGLKPHDKGHKIVCASVAVSKDLVYVFMIPERKKDRSSFLFLLADKHVGKIAQNMKFEHAWTWEYLGINVENWVWDTMLASHLLDNRTGTTSIKFQTYVQFGVVDYDSEINPYLKAKDDKNANSINRIYELVEKPGGKEKLLKYCALDSIYEMRLSIIQRKLIIP
jgi:uracil-DNA glycosylase family 4